MDDLRSFPSPASEPSDPAVYGTREPRPLLHELSAGPLTAAIEDGALRSLRWRGVEIVRGVSCLLRDGYWGTLPAEGACETFATREGGFSYERRFGAGEGAVRCRLAMEGSADGRLVVRAEIDALRELDVNRAGLTVLHPIRGVAGTALTIRHADGTRERTCFPALISPSQPAFDIAGLSHVVSGMEVDIAFSGEVFEMEDQRNWTDASLKTYCRPLSRPAPFPILPGEPIRQEIAIRIRDAKPSPPIAAATTTTAVPDERMPEIVLPIEPGFEPATGSLGELGIRTASLRIGTDADGATLEGLARSLGGPAVDLEAIIPHAAEPLPALQDLAARLAQIGIQPGRVLALPEPYLKSHQPAGPWPAGPTPADAARAARDAFPGARIGGGMLTSFTELNRCPPDPALADYVTHGTTAIVHAADDRSVIETLEALPDIFESAKALTPGRPYRLGLVSIGMRSNPYGPEQPRDPAGRRLAMARHDPRQRGLFAAAFAVGAMAATEGHGIEALALAAPAGPFGMIEESGALRPIFHVVRAFATMAGAARMPAGALPSGIAGVATRTRLVLANLSARPEVIPLPQPAPARILDAASFPDAAADPRWSSRQGTPLASVALGPYAVAFLDISGASA